MSGTSMDGIDAALLQIDREAMRVRAGRAREWPAQLQRRLRRAAEQSDSTGLAELGELDTAVGIELANAAAELLRAESLPAAAVRAIGSHGQTLLHRPAGDLAFTLQIGDPNIIAERLGVDVVADFRRRDLAAGGEGAPLMPAFHAAAFGTGGQTRAVVNIGGMANVTLLRADGSVIGFDTGPGNCLLDAWARRHIGQPFDAQGRWAARGRAIAPLLARLLADPYFARAAPKSTGRETFSDAWLEGALADEPVERAPADIQATLAELTAQSIATALAPPGGDIPADVFVCGGGAFNVDLMQRLAHALPQARWQSTAGCGIAPEHVEAAGFAWLAHRCIEGLAGNLPSVTGARHPAPLGAIFRGRLA